jgi:GT2 family glycosyltransferase
MSGGAVPQLQEPALQEPAQEPAPGEAEAALAHARESVTIVVLTHNRREELLRTLARLRALPEQAAIVVVDNASADGSAQAVRQAHPQVRLVRSARNLGAAGRNLGVDAARTPYVAFCDDDTWWAPGALARAVQLLDAWPEVAALSAHVRVGREQREDPTCQVMAHSPLPSAGPGPGLIGFMAGAAVVRVEAFRAAGGYERRLFLGAEERLLGLDLLARGWRIAYAPEVVSHHHPSPLRDAGGRRVLLARNTAWIALLRLPWPSARHELRQVWRLARAGGYAAELLRCVLAGLPWVLRERRVLPAEVEQQRQQVLGAPPPPRRGWAR